MSRDRSGTGGPRTRLSVSLGAAVALCVLASCADEPVATNSSVATATAPTASHVSPPDSDVPSPHVAPSTTTPQPQFTWRILDDGLLARLDVIRSDSSHLLVADTVPERRFRLWTWTPGEDFSMVELPRDMRFFPASFATDGDRLAVSGGLSEWVGGNDEPILAVGPIGGPLDVEVQTPRPLPEIEAWSGWSELRFHDGRLVGIALGRDASASSPNSRDIPFRGTRYPVTDAWRYELVEEPIQDPYWGPTPDVYTADDRGRFRRTTFVDGAAQDAYGLGVHDDVVVGTRWARDRAELWVDRGTGVGEPVEPPNHEMIERTAFGAGGLLVATGTHKEGEWNHTLHHTDLRGDWTPYALPPADDPDWATVVQQMVPVGTGFVVQLIHLPPLEPEVPDDVDTPDLRVWELWYLEPQGA